MGLEKPPSAFLNRPKRWKQPVLNRKLKVMVLAGGPDRERPISLVSGRHVAAALREAGHRTLERDILPGEFGALNDWRRWGGHVVFPVLHGPWGEGGPLQQVLEQQRIPYVGCRSRAARLCMNKHLTKLALVQQGLPTPPFELLTQEQKRSIPAPFVLKATTEGSSIDVVICQTHEEAEVARRKLVKRHKELLVEAFVPGKELTVGVIDSPAGPKALPPIRIIPATPFYDYQAKYHRNDTRYVLDPKRIGLPAKTLNQVRDLAVATHRALGCRHMCRVDLIVDDRGESWILEVNTIPGFTDHSLLPKAAAYSGMALPELVNRLVQMAFDGR